MTVSKDLRISVSVYKLFFACLQAEETKRGERISYSEYIALLCGQAIDVTRKQHKDKRYAKYNGGK